MVGGEGDRDEMRLRNNCLKQRALEGDKIRPEEVRGRKC